MDILSWLVFGLCVGAIARFLLPGNQPYGCIGTIALGVLGSVMGGAVAKLLWKPGPMEPAGWGMSVLGAVIVLAVVSRKRPSV